MYSALVVLRATLVCNLHVHKTGQEEMVIAQPILELTGEGSSEVLNVQVSAKSAAM
jgi:hypothetical protein